MNNNQAASWWLRNTEAGRRMLARMLPPKAYRQATGREHPRETAEREEEERRKGVSRHNKAGRSLVR
jgi:hypothetical protein